MSAYWCALAWLGDDEPETGVRIDVVGDRIVDVVAGQPAPNDAVRLDGLTVPGLVNAHSHAFHRALRGRTQGEAGSFWTWREHMYALAARLDPDVYLALATAAYAEMALAGVTTVGEFHYLHDGTNTMGDALIEAAGRAGLRMTLLDTCYLHGGIGRDREGPQRRFGDSAVDAWAQRASDRVVDGRNARLGAAIHSVRTVTPAEAAVVAAWASERDVVVHAHVSEQPAENEACLAAFGRTPTAVLAEAGAVNRRFCAVHATHVSLDDTAVLGQAHAAVCFCPTTERDLADGIGPAAALVGAGARLCLGSDSHAVVDLLEEARAVELNERLATGTRGHHRPATLLAAATVGGAAALGWPEAGRLAPGYLADFVTIALGGVRLAGTPPADVVAAAVFAGTAADVTHVVSAGRSIVAGAQHLLIDDVPGALSAAIRALT